MFIIPKIPLTKNGTNHDVNVYPNINDYTKNRNGEAVLTNMYSPVVKTYPKEQPLNVYPVPMASTNDSTLYYPESFFGHVDEVPHWWTYDRIIVSSIYAEAAVKKFSALEDYLDRLFVPVPLKASANGKVIGCIGFEKVTPPKSPSHYMRLIDNRFSPSYYAIKLCVSHYSSITNMINENLALERLKIYMNSFQEAFA